jgi:hypothetical protein
MSNASLCRRILEFFQANPHEELSVDDMAAKFGVKSPSINMALMDLRKDARVAAVERVSVYRVVPKA